MYLSAAEAAVGDVVALFDGRLIRHRYTNEAVTAVKMLAAAPCSGAVGGGDDSIPKAVCLGHSRLAVASAWWLYSRSRSSLPSRTYGPGGGGYCCSSYSVCSPSR